jgi:hypothetical protein
MTLRLPPSDTDGPQRPGAGPGGSRQPVNARRPARRESDDDDDGVDSGPSQADIERFSNVSRLCPSCRKEVFDDVEICYHCGEAISRQPKGPPLWALWTTLIVVVVFVGAIVGPVIMRSMR